MRASGRGRCVRPVNRIGSWVGRNCGRKIGYWVRSVFRRPFELYFITSLSTSYIFITVFQSFLELQFSLLVIHFCTCPVCPCLLYKMRFEVQICASQYFTYQSSTALLDQHSNMRLWVKCKILQAVSVRKRKIY